MGTTIKLFYEAFANKKKQPALILKTSGATYSILDREDTLRKIKEVKSQFPSEWKLPNVYLLHGELSNTEINYLYNHPKVKALFSLTHGEGYGRPLQEASMVGLPIMVSGWSGHLDFLNNKETLLVPGKIEKVPQSQVWENIIIPESKWFYIDSNSAYKGFNMLFTDFKKFKKNAKSLMYTNRNKFTLKNMTRKFGEIIEKYSKGLPEQVTLNLPKLKKVKETI